MDVEGANQSPDHRMRLPLSSKRPSSFDSFVPAGRVPWYAHTVTSLSCRSYGPAQALLDRNLLHPFLRRPNGLSTYRPWAGNCTARSWAADGGVTDGQSDCRCGFRVPDSGAGVGKWAGVGDHRGIEGYKCAYHFDSEDDGIAP